MPRARPDLGHHAAGDDARCDERLGLAHGQRVEPPAVGVADAVDVGQEDGLPGAETCRDPGRRVVRIHVAHDAVLISCERCDDRHLVGHEERVEQVAAETDDVGDEAHVRDPLADQEAAVDAREADRVDADVVERRDQLAVHDAAQDRRGDLDRGLVGDPQAALEARWDAEALEPLGHPLAAAMDDDDRPPTRNGRDLLEDLALLLDRRPAQLDDDDLAHRLPPARFMSCTPSSRSRTPR